MMTALAASRVPARAIAAFAIASLLLLALIAWRGDTAVALGAYLYMWLFCLGISLGSLAVVLVHQLTGGAWGGPVRRPLQAAAATLPTLVALFLPVLVGMRVLYPWTHALGGAEDALVQAKGWYLDTGFFAVRALVYFGTWVVLVQWLKRLWRQSVSEGTPPRNTTRASVVGLLVYSLTMTFAAIDWIMSLTPAWYSTVFGLMTLVGQATSGFAFAIAAAALLQGEAQSDRAQRFHDLGNLLLMFVMTWTYLAYVQYLVIWIEDLPKDASWYVTRAESSWRWLALALLVFHFALPTLLLLWRKIKREPRLLGMVAAMVLAAHWADSVWQVAPAQRPQGLGLTWSDITATLGLGGIWLALWLRQLASIPEAVALRSEPASMLHHG